MKLLGLAIKNAGMRWRRAVEWTAAMGQFALHFGSRLRLQRHAPSAVKLGGPSLADPELGQWPILAEAA